MAKENLEVPESPEMTVTKDLHISEMTWNDFREVTDDQSLWRLSFCVLVVCLFGVSKSRQKVLLILACEYWCLMAYMYIRPVPLCFDTVGRVPRRAYCPQQSSDEVLT